MVNKLVGFGLVGLVKNIFPLAAYPMEASAPGIYAVGDCREGNTLEIDQPQIIDLWANANYRSAVAEANMTGHTAALPVIFYCLISADKTASLKYSSENPICQNGYKFSG